MNVFEVGAGGICLHVRFGLRENSGSRMRLMVFDQSTDGAATRTMRELQVKQVWRFVPSITSIRSVKQAVRFHRADKWGQNQRLLL